MSNNQHAAEARALMLLLEDQELNETVDDCVTPFVNSLRANLLQDQENAGNPTRLSFAVFEQLRNQLPEIFGIDALQAFIEQHQWINESSARAFVKARAQIEDDNS